MNNTIEVLEGIRTEVTLLLSYFEDDRVEVLLHKNDIRLSPDSGKALTKAIDNEKALESSSDVLPEKMLTGKPPIQGNWGNGIIDGFNQAIDLCQIVLAKQILKVAELEAKIKENPKE